MSDPFSYAVIGKAMEVHRELGPGVDEMFYHELLSQRLCASGIAHLKKPRKSLVHRGIIADVFEPDIVFPDKLVSELKCLHGAFDGEHYLQLICYLKFWQLSTGLLFDFGKESLCHRRVNFVPVAVESFDPKSLLYDAGDLESDRELAAAMAQGIGRILLAYGLGYRDTTYRGLLAAEFQAEQLACVPAPVAPVCAGAEVLGETRCDCLSVGKKFGVSVLALRDGITAADIAILRTHLKLLQLRHGLILNFGKTSLEHVWIRRPYQIETSES